MDRVEGYKKTYAILKSYKKEEFLPYALNVREFWADRFLKSDLNFSEKKEILKEITFLFKEFERFEIEPYKYYLGPLFDHIVHGRFDEAVLLADVLKYLLNEQEKLQREKNKDLEKIIKYNQNIESLKTQNIYLENLVKTYKSRKSVKTTDKISKTYQLPKSYYKKINNKNNQTLNFKNENKQIYSNQNFSEIENLKTQNIYLENLVKTYKSRKSVKTTDKISKTYQLPKSYYKKINNKKSRKNREIPKKINDIKVAIIFDEFSYNCFKYEFNAIIIEPSNWLKIFENEVPDLFLCESVWHGIDKEKEPWKGIISREEKISDEKKEILDDILKYCNENSIPSIFWNKEDPIDFDTFLQNALKFDHIFTTDERCIEKYKSYGHDSVHCLMFAGQPKIFNPIDNIQKRSEDVVFAGSWYNRFPKRCNEMEEILDNILNSGFNLKIYNRFYNSIYPAFQFPNKYDKYINPSIPFNQIKKVYKESKYALNINTITESNSMFSRRVFELMLCNTLVLSNYSKAIYNLFGDNVITISQDKIEISDPETKIINNLYNALKNHTYENRFKQILDDINYEYVQQDRSITIYYIVNSQSEIKEVLKHFKSIMFNNSKLVIILSNLIQNNSINNIYKIYENSEIEFHSLKDLITQKEVISNETTFFVFADLNLKPDFIEKAILHYSYIDKKFGIALGNKFIFKTFYDINNVIFANLNFKNTYKKVLDNNSIGFSVYTIKI